MSIEVSKLFREREVSQELLEVFESLKALLDQYGKEYNEADLNGKFLTITSESGEFEIFNDGEFCFVKYDRSNPNVVDLVHLLVFDRDNNLRSDPGADFSEIKRYMDEIKIAVQNPENVS